MKSNKELKEAYKNYKPPMGVFQIKNETNGKILVEGNTNMTAIWNRYRLQLAMNNHPNKALQSDWNTFGESQFTFTVIDTLEEKEESNLDYAKEVKLLEGMYLEELQPFDERGYNKRPTHIG